MLGVVLRKAEDHCRVQPKWPVLYLPEKIGNAFHLSTEVIERLALTNLFFFCYADITDDAEDGDLREPWQAWGWPQAVNVGNALLFLALNQLGQGCPSDIRLRLFDSYTRAGFCMTQGQHFDLLSTFPSRISMDDYLRSVTGKTGASASVFACSPAIVAQQSPSRIEALAEYGRNLGVVVQLASDVREFWQDPIGPDLKNGKLTLPLLFALERVSPEEEHQLRECLLIARQTGHAQPIRDLVEGLGVRLYAEMKIELFRRRAREALATVFPDSDLYDDLVALLDIPVFARTIPVL